MSRQPYDLAIVGGDVVDGTGGPRRRADVAVAGGCIAAVGDAAAWEAAERVDAAGLVVAPGFIDVHTHDDRAVLDAPDHAPKVSQGVATVIVGNCGIGLAPLDLAGQPPPPLNILGGPDRFRFPTFESYLAALEDAPAAVNVGVLAGHSSLRVAAMDDLDAAATPGETDAMARLLEAALDAGCLGMSVGLDYPTAAAAPTAEVTALAAVVGSRGGLLTAHIRNEGDRVMAAVEEMLDIGAASGAEVVFSHHKCCGRRNWGRSRETLGRIAAARRDRPVALDVYPYTASSTILRGEHIADCERVMITWSTPHPEAAGRDLDAIAASWNCAVDEAVERLQPAGAIYFHMDEADLERILAFPEAMIGSDGLPHDALPHPRLWGTFPRVLGRYCRERGVLALEEAVHRMTGVPARVFGLADRGTVTEGGFADLVLFDPETVADRSEYGAPPTPADGIHGVWVNGARVWDGGAPTGRRGGRLLRRAA